MEKRRRTETSVCGILRKLGLVSVWWLGTCSSTLGEDCVRTISRSLPPFLIEWRFTRDIVFQYSVHNLRAWYGDTPKCAEGLVAEN